MEYSNITTLLTDSRSLLDSQGTLFFALRTASGDGHKYIRDLYDRGVRDFVVETTPADSAEMPDATFHVTDSPLSTLQNLGASHRRASDALVIGITGSRGKTTVKEWIYRLLSPGKRVVRSPRSYNSQTGVPLSLWNIRPDTEIAVIEAGISQPGEMARLESIISPEIGIFTNIGNQHSQGFGSTEEKCREKALLMRGCRSVIYCADNSLIASCLPDGPEHVGWTRDNASDARLRVTAMTKSDGATTIYYIWKSEPESDLTIEGSVKIPFTAEHDIENALHALTLMLLLGYTPDTISERMSTLRPVRTRLNVIDGVNDCQLIHDTFASDVTSLALSLDFVERRLTPDHTLTVILGDMDTQGDDRTDTYRRVAQLLKLRNVSRVIAIGPHVYAERDSLPSDVTVYESVEQFLAADTADDFRSELILVKGSPDASLEEVARLLEKKRHETVLEINLDAVVDNFNFFRSLIRPTTGMVCMIKASGYGAGSHELAKT
ncbi:MAG: bifunctional UDP-N-acetylmuramoyl-tripeptide:D-alanyl-D-alanine ligase/alanine racemase, partial [Duncaniella sp.]|nr:bifunctional UDP-N-acetylmuramoyl-tripeptide:D-alanyl-D-alanine ligase/alanine racemase [Duncaniella sp.]